eukprot:2929567-Rhodomonas_salina.1
MQHDFTIARMLFSQQQLSKQTQAFHPAKCKTILFLQMIRSFDHSPETRADAVTRYQGTG